MSATLPATAWNLPMGWPNCFRARAYSTHASSWRCMAPTALARMQLRSQVIAELKIAIPAPSAPRRLAAGTRQPSSTTSPIGEVRRPILSRPRLTVNPGVPFSTRKAEMPAILGRPGCAAKTSTTSETGALVMYSLVPFSTYPSPSRSARVRRANASDPDSGSVIACTPMRSPDISPGR